MLKTARPKEGRAALVNEAPVERQVFSTNPDGYEATGLYETTGEPICGVPKNKDMKLHLAKFSANET